MNPLLQEKPNINESIVFTVKYALDQLSVYNFIIFKIQKHF